MSKQRSVFISGAAAGIGAAVARRFLNLGWRVGVYDIAEVNLDDFPQTQATLVTGKLDVSDAEQWRTALLEFCGEGGTLDVLVNNAGILSSGKFVDIPLELQQATINVNVNGTMNGCYEGYDYLKRTPGATVVNMCSASAIYGQPELVSYSASKFAVRGLTEALDLEWEDDDIRVFALWPLFVATDMVTGMETGATRSLGIKLGPEDVADELVDAVLKPSPFPRPHYSVGIQAKVFANLAKMSPNWMNRMTNKRIASRK